MVIFVVNLKIKEMKAKAVEFTDNGIKYVELTRGTYEVDGVVIECKEYNNKVSVVDLNSVKPILRATVVCYYTTNGEDRHEVEWYEDRKNELLKKQTTIDLGDYETLTKWDSLEDEFAYRKFTSLYTPIKKDIDVVGDPIKFDVTSTVLETGNPFIKSEFVNGEKDLCLFSYNRPSALLKIVSDCFTALGMEFKGDISYAQTASVKKWGNSTHSCIRYVTAFGGYLFTDLYNNVSIQRGTLESLHLRYESDKKDIERIIKTKYNIAFGSVDEKAFNFNKLLSTIKSAEYSARKIQPKQSTYTEYKTALSKLLEAITQIETSFKE